VIEPVEHGGEGIGVGAVVRFASCAAMAHQLCPLEDCQVLGDRGLGYAGAAGKGVNRLFAVAGEVLEDGTTGGVGESFEEIVSDGWHVRTITKRLSIVKVLRGRRTLKEKERQRNAH